MLALLISMPGPSNVVDDRQTLEEMRLYETIAVR